jgi:hypothetical protein
VRFMRWETGPTDVMAVPEFAPTSVEYPGGLRRGNRNVVVRWHAVVMTGSEESDRPLCAFHTSRLPTRVWETTADTVRCPRCSGVLAALVSPLERGDDKGATEDVTRAPLVPNE